MGAGDDLAGNLPAGDDPVITVPAARVVPTVQALYLDPTTRDFPLDGNGFYVGLHPVDARVELAMVVAAGTIKTAPAVGNKLLRNRYITPQYQTQATYEVNRVLKDEVSAGNVEVLDITVQQSGSGGVFVQLRYYNLVLDPERSTIRTSKKVVSG